MLFSGISNKVRYKLDLICKVAMAMREVARECQIPIRWGGNWDVLLNDTDTPPEEIVHDYIQKRISQGRKPFVDGPHYELPQPLYP